jgi:hypothetical protein
MRKGVALQYTGQAKHYRQRQIVFRSAARLTRVISTGSRKV